MLDVHHSNHIFVESLYGRHSYSAAASRTHPTQKRNILVTRIHDGNDSRLCGVFDRMEEWETYMERVDIYLAANKITNMAQKREVLQYFLCEARKPTIFSGTCWDRQR